MRFLYKNCWKIYWIIQLASVIFLYIVSGYFYASLLTTLLLVAPSCLFVFLPMRLMIEQIERDKYW